MWTQAQPQPATSGQEPPALPPSPGCEGGEARLRRWELWLEEMAFQTLAAGLPHGGPAVLPYIVAQILGRVTCLQRVGT